MKLDFNQTGSLLNKHGKTFLKRQYEFRFQWSAIEAINIDIIARGFKFSNPDDFSNNEFKATDDMKKIAQWMTDTKGKGLALIGQSGRGKTMFLHGVLPHLLINKGKVPHSIKAVDLDNMNYGKILLIDEVGREDKVFDKIKGKIDRFPLYVDYCADHGRPLFFTSNLSKQQFIDRYDIHIYNRVTSITNTVICNGESMW
jgi:DNA replication protein DnaC